MGWVRRWEEEEKRKENVMPDLFGRILFHVDQQTNNQVKKGASLAPLLRLGRRGIRLIGLAKRDRAQYFLGIPAFFMHVEDLQHCILLIGLANESMPGISS